MDANHSDFFTTAARPCFATAAECYQAGLYDPATVPESEVARLIDYCRRHGLELSARQQEAYIILFEADGRYVIFCTPAGFFRLCRATRRWLPGSCRFEYLNPPGYESQSKENLVAYASCHVRDHVESERWVEVGYAAKLKDYYARVAGTPLADVYWRISPEHKLRLVAMIEAARLGLGPLVEGHRTLESTMEILFDPHTELMIQQADVQRQRLRAMIQHLQGQGHLPLEARACSWERFCAGFEQDGDEPGGQIAEQRALAAIEPLMSGPSGR